MEKQEGNQPDESQQQEEHDPARGPRTNPAVPHTDGNPDNDPKGPSKERGQESPADASSGTGEDVQAGQGTVTGGGGAAGGTSGN